MNLPKTYNSKESEQKWLSYWEKEKIFAFNPNSKKKIFSIDTPPPTVSGEMHIGHAFSYSHMDFVARYKRMAGFELFYPFGTDDNGLPTERLIEQVKNIKHQDMSREEFVKLCLETLEKELRPKYIQDWKNIAISSDYDIYYTTINEHCQRISQKSFLDLYKIKRAYQKEAPTIWCPACHMALAQVELQDKELGSTFNDVIFKLEGGSDIVIATTRPELLPSCVAVFVHPKDKKNKHLVGKKAVVPIFGQNVPIIADERVDMEKGTGIVMCCTFGDQTDIEWYLAHKLPMKISITPDGKMNELAGKYKGLSTKQARAAITDDLGAHGFLKTQKKITHTVNVHDKCGTEIEILHTKQWFIKYLDLKEKLRKAGASMNWHPSHMINRYTNWIEGLQWDWCISRQRFFGVPIPVWYCKKCSNVLTPDEKDLPIDPLKDKPKKKCKCGSNDFIGEKDVLDTWATSSLTPQIAASLFPKLYKKLYPMSLRPQAHDLITFWLFNTVVKSQLHNNVNPWRDIMISGWALDPHGKKMSKSKGNVVAPAEMISKYSVDALRFWAAGLTLGEDVPFQEKDLFTGQKFVTKIWNSSKFAIMNLKDFKPKAHCPLPKAKLRTADKWILSKLNNLIRESTEAFDKYNFAKVKRDVESFYWHEFCDNYLEIVKDRLYNPNKYGKGGKEAAQYTLHNLVLSLVKLIAPIMPYITEEVYHLHFAKSEKSKSIHISGWPKFDKKLVDKKAEEAGEILKKLVAAVRQFKQSKNISLGAELKAIYIKTQNSKLKTILKDLQLDLLGVSRAKEIKFGKAEGEKVDIKDLPAEIFVVL